MKTTGVAILKKTSALPTGTLLAEMAILCGKGKGDKTRYLNGSFIYGEKTEGMVDVELALMQNGEPILVNFEIADLHCESNVSGEKVYLNYRGFLRGISVRDVASEA